LQLKGQRKLDAFTRVTVSEAENPMTDSLGWRQLESLDLELSTVDRNLEFSKFSSDGDLVAIALRDAQTASRTSQPKTGTADLHDRSTVLT